MTLIEILTTYDEIMVWKSPTQDGVVTRNKAKLQERQRRIQAIKEASRGVFTSSKAKESEEELHQAITTLKVLRKCKSKENSKRHKNVQLVV